MSDTNGNGRDAFSRLEAQERKQMMASQKVPPPAEAPKLPACNYCGQPLDGPHAKCPFCPERKESQDAPDNGGNEPLQPAMRGVFEEP